MKRNLFKIKAVLLAFSALLSISATTFAQNNKPSVSKEEAAAAEKVQKAVDVPAKFLAAGEFVKKYPTSTLRLGMAQHIADQIKAVKDAAQRVSFSEQFFNVFTEANETDEIIPTLIDAYLDTKKYDEAFQVSENYLSRHTDDVILFTIMGVQGANLARMQNNKFAKQGYDYSVKALAMLEADKKPANLNDTAWANYKTTNLPTLYQSVGFLEMISNKPVEAKAKFEKALALNPNDAQNYYFLGYIVEGEYEETAKAYRNAPEGKQRDDLFAKATSQMDAMIDYYAHTVAILEAKPETKAQATQIRSNLEKYYKFRHKNLDGMENLINKYKPKP